MSFASDAAGDTQFDGRYVYQYDALGRLVQVSEKGSCSVTGSGQLTGTPGPWVEHRTYDGLGRLIRVQAPWPTTGTGYVVSRRFYYDGDRRIARVSTLPYSPEGVNLGDPGRIKGEIDLEKQDTWVSSTDRLWVWDPTDTDRLVAVYGDSPDNAAPSNPLSRAWLTVTDLDGTPVAVLDHSTGTAVGRYEYDATGNLLSSAYTAAPDGQYPPRLEVGWKGLFAERLDSPLTDQVLVSEDGTSSAWTGTGAAVIYDVRARVYRPALGRFMQQDPLGMGVPVNEILRWHGQTPSPILVYGFEAASHYRDGQHAMALGRGRSAGISDPTGLFALAGWGDWISGVMAEAQAGTTALAAEAQAVAALTAQVGSWSVSMTLTGGLMVAYNLDFYGVYFSQAASSGGSLNPDDWLNEMGGSGGGGGGPPKPVPGQMTTDQRYCADLWSVSQKAMGQAIHTLKGGSYGSGARSNPDIDINFITGDAFIKGTSEYLGNLKHLLEG